MTSADFKPSFQDNIDVQFGLVGPGRQFVNPLYCATPETADDLVSILADLKPTVILQPPNGPIFIGIVKLVPWLIFPNGSRCNAGLLASCWTHGLPGNISERNCRQDIASQMAYDAAGGI